MNIEKALRKAREEKRRDAGEERPTKPKTVPVRIAVAVERKGRWAACGGSGLSDEEAIDGAAECGDDRIVWVTANVPLPEETEVRGEVEG